MFLLAYVGGSGLGSFVVRGLADSDEPPAHASDAENFWQAQDNSGVQAAAAAADPAQRFSYASPGNHVCEGCDAGATRDKQIAGYLNMAYPGASPDEDATPSGGVAAVAAPPPVARITLPPPSSPQAAPTP